MDELLLIIILILLLYILIGFILYFFIIVSGNNLLFSIVDKQIEKMLIPYKSIHDKAMDFYNKSNKKELHIKSFDNTDLYGTFIENKKSKYVLILCHGYRSTKERDVYASMSNYYDWGYSILAIDERGCGKSSGKHITFGYKESKDINAWVDYIYKKYKKEVILGGVSLGASSILMVNNKHVKLIIEDSGFENAYKQVRYTLLHYSKLPLNIFMPFICLFVRIFAKTKLKKVDVNDNLKNLNIPILFIHGSKDDFVPLKNVYSMYEKYNGPKDILVIDDAPHGMGYLIDEKAYLKKIRDFIDKYMV